MSLAEIVPPEWRSAAAMLGAIVIVGGGALAADARIKSTADEAARVAVAAKWDEVYQQKALAACTTAADQGAYRAVSEAMGQTIIPMQRSIDAHLAAQNEHERNDERRFAAIERRVGIR